MFGFSDYPDLAPNGALVDPSRFGRAGLAQGGAGNLLGNPMFMAGLGLLSAGRDRNIDPFQSIQSGLLAANQVQSQQADADYRRAAFGMKKQEFEAVQAQRQRQQDALTKVQGLLDAGDQEGAARAALSSGDPTLTTWGGNVIAPKRPATLQEFDAYSGMTPEQQAQYKEFTQIGRKDTTPYFTPIQTSGGFQTFDNRTGRIVPLTGSDGRPLLPIAADVGLAGNKSAAEASGTATGKGQAEARMDQPRVDMNADLTLGVLDALQKHPGRQYATGMYSIAPTIPGTSQADFRAYLDQLNGQTFLQAYQSLKGGGQITEIEGKKATDAIARIKAAQTDAEFDKGVEDLRSMITTARDINRRKGGQQPAAPGASPAAGAPKFLGFE